MLTMLVLNTVFASLGRAFVLSKTCVDSTETVGGLITLGLTESMCKQDRVAHSWAVDEVENNSF